MNLTIPQRRILSWLALGLVAFILLWLLSSVLTPFLIGAVLAYALHPAVERLAARGVPRVLAVLLVEVAVFFAVFALVLLMVPILSKELPLLRDQLPLLAERINRGIAPLLAQFGINIALDPAGIKVFVVKYMNANVDDWLATLLSSARIGGGIAIAIVGSALLVPVVLFYLLMDWPQLVRHVQSYVPPRVRPAFESFMDECDEVLGQYLRGQLLVMVTMAVFYSVGLALFGFDLAIPIGVFTGLAMFIPYVGFGIGMMLALLGGVLQFPGWYGAGSVALVYGIGQLIEGFFLTPRLVGERIGLNPLMVIFALLAFGHLFGLTGVLVALPVSAVLAVAAHHLRGMYMESRLFGAD